MAETYATLTALFTDIADAIREKTGDTAPIIADNFPDVIRGRLQVIPPPACLTFSSPNSFTLKVNDATKHWDGTLEYSTDANAWSTWDGTTVLSSATSGSKNILYLRGTGNTIIAGDPNYRWVLNGSNIACSGNIETLLDYETVESGEHPSMANNCYSYMFRSCASLAQAPALSATTLTNGCYGYMFQGCTGLTQAPALPATTLAPNCYSCMFFGCSSLTQVPALPATKLNVSCYFKMFYRCPKIKLSSTQTGEYTVAYRIPAAGTGTTATGALDSMFTNTGGTFTGTPVINTTYYLSNTNTVV